ncbi:MAG: TraB/GumN family protein [Bacteroidetes bacterium]|nr:TraB/GumN family protein [Bacteroidota bacterium]
MFRFTLYLICFSYFVQAQSEKKYPALLWKITGKELKKTSYLYGTMHVSNKVAYHLSNQFFDALKSVDVVGLETNPGEWLKNMELTGELEQLNQYEFNNANSDFYTTAFNYKYPKKRELQGVLSYDPEIINGLLYRQNRTGDNFEENTYIDLFIYQAASKLNKELISLENFVQSEIYAKLAMLPDKLTHEDADIESAYNDYTGHVTIEDAYRDGNLDLLDSLSKKSSTKNTQRFLINARNEFFVHTIDSVIKLKSLFSGVGAAHLPGENGVIELLRKKGYTVEPIIPVSNKKSDDERDKIDALVKPVSFHKQFSADSLFSVQVPGKLYQIINLENIKYQICADMTNGNFYTVARLKAIAPLSGISKEQLMVKTDSLFFENIPGKIISKKEIISNTGLKGFDIINKTRKGDYQRYQLFFSDLELILFKLGGKHEYAIGNEAKQFFNSIQFSSINNNEKIFSPKTKGFEVKAPANMFYSKNTGSSLSGLVEDFYAYSNLNKVFFGIKHAVFNDFSYIEQDTFELNQLAKNCLENFDFKNNKKFTFGEYKGLPQIVFSASNKKQKLFTGKIIIKGVHYYLQYTVSDSGTSYNSVFFESFKLTDFDYLNPLKEIKDKELYFSAIDEVSETPQSKFNELYASALEKVKIKRKEDSYSDYDSKMKSKLYYSPSSNEYVSILFEKYNDYEFQSKKEFEKILHKNISRLGMIVGKFKTAFANNVYSYSVTLKDTATSRALDIYVLLKNGTRYEYSAPYDTTVGYNGWQKKFINSFKIKDTLIGKSLFDYKYDKLLNDLVSTDTSVAQKASNSILNSVSTQKEYATDFIKFLSNNNFSKVNEATRAQLLVNGGLMKSDAIVDAYKNTYKQYTDSFYIQLCVLKGLAYLKSKASFNAFLDLLTDDPPLIGDANAVSDVLLVLNDSLELCKNYFPLMYSLTKYDEYKTSVYNILTDLLENDYITPKAYKSQKDNILADANLALKRYKNTAGKPGVLTEDYKDFESLDKTSKEQAIELKQLVDAYNQNIYFRSNPNTKAKAYYCSDLINYAKLLAPFYKNDNRVKLYFSKLLKIKNQQIQLLITVLSLKHKFDITDTMAGYFSSNKNTRAYFYTELEKNKLLHFFDKNYSNQKSIVESVMYSEKQLKNYFSFEKERAKKDSLSFVKELKAHNAYENGIIYLFKHSKFKNEENKWSIAFVNTQKDKINSNVEIIKFVYYPDNLKTEEENINKILNEFYLKFRRRVNFNTIEAYSPYGNEGY